MLSKKQFNKVEAYKRIKQIDAEIKSIQVDRIQLEYDKFHNLTESLYKEISDSLSNKLYNLSTEKEELKKVLNESTFYQTNRDVLKFLSKI